MTGRPRAPRGGDGEASSSRQSDAGDRPRATGPGSADSVAAAQEAIAEVARSGRPGKEGGISAPESSLPAPSFAAVEIDAGKITEYAMNPQHPVGRNKYRVINSATGFDTGDAARIDQQIRAGVRVGTPIEGRRDQYGQRWSVDVPLTGPKGVLVVRTAWILDAESATPRLVTISFP